MKIGDTVVMSSKNLNHLGNDVCAYAGYKGIVSDIFEDDGAFIIKSETSTLVVPANDAFKNRLKGVWIHLNDEHVFHNFIQLPKQPNLLQKFISRIFS